MNKIFNRVTRNIYVNDNDTMFEIVMTYRDDGLDDISINNLWISPYNRNGEKLYIIKTGLLDYYHLRNSLNYNEVNEILENWNSFEYDIKKDLINSIFTLIRTSYTD